MGPHFVVWAEEALSSGKAVCGGEGARVLEEERLVGTDPSHPIHPCLEGESVTAPRGWWWRTQADDRAWSSLTWT